MRALAADCAATLQVGWGRRAGGPRICLRGCSLLLCACDATQEVVRTPYSVSHEGRLCPVRGGPLAAGTGATNPRCPGHVALSWSTTCRGASCACCATTRRPSTCRHLPQVTDDGDIVWLFPRGFQDTIRSKSLLLRLEPTAKGGWAARVSRCGWPLMLCRCRCSRRRCRCRHRHRLCSGMPGQPTHNFHPIHLRAAVKAGAEYAARVAFGTALMVSVAVVAVALTAIATSGCVWLQAKAAGRGERRSGVGFDARPGGENRRLMLPRRMRYREAMMPSPTLSAWPPRLLQERQQQGQAQQRRLRRGPAHVFQHDRPAVVRARWPWCMRPAPSLALLRCAPHNLGCWASGCRASGQDLGCWPSPPPSASFFLPTSSSSPPCLPCRYWDPYYAQRRRQRMQQQQGMNFLEAIFRWGRRGRVGGVSRGAGPVAARAAAAGTTPRRSKPALHGAVERRVPPSALLTPPASPPLHSAASPACPPPPPPPPPSLCHTAGCLETATRTQSSTASAGRR